MSQTPKQIADELEKLCCAETEGAFFDYVTEGHSTIQRHLRAAAKYRFALDLICSLVQPMGRNDTNLMVAQRIAREAIKAEEPDYAG